MIYRLTYCNKDGDNVRIDITTPGGSTVQIVEGTGDPFRLIRKNDKSDKSGHFMTSSAEINIYETPSFNIDTLKTSSETDIKVDRYINGVKDWTGFVIPDFFSREIGGSSVVSMIASDRIGTLKGVTLSDLPDMLTIYDLATRCLDKTGLSLPLKTMCDFTNDGLSYNGVFRSYVMSYRLYDTKGRSISCYYVLQSILVLANSMLVQRNAEWYIVNKLQHEIGSGRVYSDESTYIPYQEVVKYFSEITKGAYQSIIPVAASVGIYHEHGGGRLYPNNYDFSQGLTGWTPKNGFVAKINNKEILGYYAPTPGVPVYEPDYGDVTDNNYLVNLKNNSPGFDPNWDTARYIESTILLPDGYSSSIEISVDINAISMRSNLLRYVVLAKKGSKILALNTAGSFETYSPTNDSHAQRLTFKTGEVGTGWTGSKIVKGVLDDADLSGYKIYIRVYGSGTGVTSFVNYLSISFKNTAEIPKGTVYKREQTGSYTKSHDTDTTIFGDYGVGPVNGYVYEYPIDDTSSLLRNDAGELQPATWIDPTDTNSEEFPLLRHIVRQKARMFSVAHDMISGEIDIVNFDPLSIFVDCNNNRYVIVSSEEDFLRSKVNVQLEQIVYGSLTAQDYIYSYFGEGESNIKSVGGISGGGGTGTGGGGMTAEQLELLNTVAGYWTLDENGNLKTTYNAYSEQEISAYGFGGSGGGGGGGVDLLQAWTDYDSTKDNWAVKAGLLVPFYNDTRSRLTALEGGAALSLNVTGTGNAIASLSKTGSTLLAVKGNFAELDANGKVLSSQLPSYVDDVISAASLAGFPVTGEAGKIYIAEDTNKTYRWSGTAYVEISSSLALGETSSTAYRGDRGKIAYDHSQLAGNPHGTTFAQIASKPTTIAGYGITNAYTKTEVNSDLALKLDKSTFEDLFEKVEVSTGVFAIKAKYTFYSIGEVSAYGYGGSGGGGGGGSLVTWSNETTEKITLTVEGIAKDLSKFGHTHAIADITGLQTALNGKALNTININAGTGLSGGGNLTANRTISLSAITIADIALGVQAKIDIDNLEIGGRNLIKNTFNDWQSITVGQYGASLDFIPIQDEWRGKEVTHAFEVKDIPAGESVRIRIDFHRADNTYITPTYGTIISGAGKTEVTYTITEDEQYVNIRARIMPVGYTANYSVLYRCQKLEKGNKATDWTPAPEDTQQADWITSGVFDIARIPTGTTGTTVALGNHTHSGVYEPVLGTPSTSGYLLSSTTAGVRSWVAPYSLPTASASVLGGVKIGANVSIASGVISVHNPVTIGTANGLSLSTQVLSLALATTAANGALSATDKTYIDLLKTFFEYDSTNNAIKALKTFYSVGEVSAYGFGGSGGGGGGLIETVYGYSNLGGTFSNSTLTDTFNAYTINQLHTRLTSVEGGSAMSITQTGAGNAVTSVTKSGTVITVTKGSTFSLSGHTHAISDVAGLQTALNGKFNNPTGTTAQYLRGDGSLATFPAIPQGTVTSVGLSAPTGFTVSGSPVTSSGTLNLAFTSGYSLPTTAKQTAWDNHLINQSNPHGVTAGQVGAYTKAESDNAISQYGLGLGVQINPVYTGDIFEIPYTWFTRYASTATNAPVNDYGSLLSIYRTTSFKAMVAITDNSGVYVKSGNNLSWYKLASVTDNVASATKLQTARTIAGVSFDGTANISIPFANLSSIPTTLSGYGITDGVINSTTITAGNGLTGGGTLAASRTITLGTPSTLSSSSTNGVAASSHTHAITTTSTGAASTIVQTNASGGTTFTGTVTAPTFSGALSGNATTATKLQTARTLWGQSFDGTGSVSGNMTGVGSITASGSFYTQGNGTRIGYRHSTSLPPMGFSNHMLTVAGTDEYGMNFDMVSDGKGYIQVGRSDGAATTYDLGLQPYGGNVVIGAINGGGYKLDVNGTGRFTGDLTAPKVIFSAAGWAMVQTGTELQMQYDGVAKMRFLNGGSIVAVEEITAYG